MWAWFRLGWARSLLLALLLGGVNVAAQRYTQDTQAATRALEFSSLGGLRAWRLSYEAPRSDGLLGFSQGANTRALMQWVEGADYLASLNAPQSKPSLWRPAFGVLVQEPLQRGGQHYGVVVAMGLGWPADDCWVLGTSPVKHSQRLTLGELASCQPIGAPVAQTAPKLAQAQQDIKALWLNGPNALVIGPALADRVLGRDWQQTTAEVWVGVGALPTDKGEEKGEAGAHNVASTPASLNGLLASGWTVHAIRHAPSALQQQAALARLRWQLAMAALGFALGVLGAWGYRHVLALMVAIRRTGGARGLTLWLDGLRLVGALAALMITVSVAVMAIQLMCGAGCGTAPAPGASQSVQTWVDGLAWLAWPWTGLIAGLLVVASGVVLTASRRSLQGIIARGGQG
jgi:hypothetical protein